MTLALSGTELLLFRCCKDEGCECNESIVSCNGVRVGDDTGKFHA